MPAIATFQLVIRSRIEGKEPLDKESGFWQMRKSTCRGQAYGRNMPLQATGKEKVEGIEALLRYGLVAVAE